MSLRKVVTATRVGTKYGLAGGTLYLYYNAGLWKGSDETIANYAQLKKDVREVYKATPEDFQKWTEYGVETVQKSVQPYQKAVADFRKEWLNFDLAFMTEKGDGVVKPTWNRGVSWTMEIVKDSPKTVGSWTKTGWQKAKDLVNEQTAQSEAEPVPSAPSSSAVATQ